MATDRIMKDRKTGERWYVHGDTGHCANLTNPRPERPVKTPKTVAERTRFMFDE